jgi:UDP-N-acetylglucosamine diphosphorylase / glucose-1-phosphate thymidylyltransferase / UDP-N-acetylgalactosamine diphosphorylase / glucosamine-1-phosphate N-acetyltransferase / galactosamine-1-phosphate N-acetyltransferase
MIPIKEYINTLPSCFENTVPWHITATLQERLYSIINTLGNDYKIDNGIAIHVTAVIEQGVILKAPVIAEAGCFIGAHAYLRGGVYLAAQVSIGPGCEIKSSIICNGSSVAHFNFIGDSIVGSKVNIEAGAVIANHYNERVNKQITVCYQQKPIDTGVCKFGALIGDDTKIGANAVLSPGTLLPPGSIVSRLQLVSQDSN